MIKIEYWLTPVRIVNRIKPWNKPVRCSLQFHISMFFTFHVFNISTVVKSELSETSPHVFMFIRVRFNPSVIDRTKHTWSHIITLSHENISRKHVCAKSTFASANLQFNEKQIRPHFLHGTLPSGKHLCLCLCVFRGMGEMEKNRLDIAFVSSHVNISKIITRTLFLNLRRCFGSVITNRNMWVKSGLERFCLCLPITIFSQIDLFVLCPFLLV